MNELFTLNEFVHQLRSIAVENDDVTDIIKRVRPLAQRLAASPDLLARCNREADPVQGFGFQTLHEEPDHTLAIAVLSWLPGRGTPPHDHGTWGVVVGVEGDEVNDFWKRVDDGTEAGHCELEHLYKKTFKPGEVIALLPYIIHSVRNDTSKLSLSLHIYGKHVNFTERSQFDIEKKTVMPWKVVLT
jgi:predicted metal-dependent enzyme (double-stranded beta helix superfamily)